MSSASQRAIASFPGTHRTRERHRRERLAYLQAGDNPRLSVSELLAELVVERCEALEVSIQRYNSVIDDLRGPDDPPFWPSPHS